MYTSLQGFLCYCFCIRNNVICCCCIYKYGFLKCGSFFSYGSFFKEDVDSVEVWREPYEANWIIWAREGDEEVCEDFRCVESGGDGWSWEFAQALEDAASEAEAGE